VAGAGRVGRRTLGNPLGTGATLWVLYSLLMPVSLASEALRDYLHHGKTTELPIGFTDRTGRQMADVRYTIEHLDKAIRSLEERSTKDYLTGPTTAGRAKSASQGISRGQSATGPPLPLR
jgi:hypothetical protein